MQCNHKNQEALERFNTRLKKLREAGVAIGGTCGMDLERMSAEGLDAMGDLLEAVANHAKSLGAPIDE